jgi:hypothetical protein
MIYHGSFFLEINYPIRHEANNNTPKITSKEPPQSNPSQEWEGAARERKREGRKG